MEVIISEGYVIKSRFQLTFYGSNYAGHWTISEEAQNATVFETRVQAEEVRRDLKIERITRLAKFNGEFRFTLEEID